MKKWLNLLIVFLGQFLAHGSVYASVQSAEVKNATGQIDSIKIRKDEGTGLYGLKWQDGSWAVKPIYISLKEWRNGEFNFSYYKTTENDSCRDKVFTGLLNKTGKMIFEVEGSSIGSLWENYMVFAKENKKGVCSKNGKVVIPVWDNISRTIYCDAMEIYPGGFIVSHNKLKGVLDTNGNDVLPVKFEYIQYNYNLKTYRVMNGAKFGIAKSGGAMLIPGDLHRCYRGAEFLFCL